MCLKKIKIIEFGQTFEFVGRKIESKNINEGHDSSKEYHNLAATLSKIYEENQKR